MHNEPTTPEAIAAFLRTAGYDPEVLRQDMQQFADTIIARERHKRLERWLDSLQDTPLTPEEVEAIVHTLKQEQQL